MGWDWDEVGEGPWETRVDEGLGVGWGVRWVSRRLTCFATPVTGFVVGHAGLLQALAMLLVAYLILALTVLSVCAIATNGAVRGGGAYCILQRRWTGVWALLSYSGEERAPPCIPWGVGQEGTSSNECPADRLVWGSGQTRPDTVVLLSSSPGVFPAAILVLLDHPVS